jgi:hypothetical protein
MSGAKVEVESVVGRVPTRVERVFYVFPGGAEPDRSKGPLQLTFSDDSVLLLRGGPDGASVVAEAEPWMDPFAQPLSAANREFVQRSGKWTLIDVSEDSFFEGFIGEPLVSVEAFSDEHTTTSGIRLTSAAVAVTFTVEADEEYVSVARA